ncbi:MAG: electron transfer flavoprotein subunit alpha/FixB family protein [Planctomycetota bacterium]|jgi:electron transfer flavoprotein alpha subunit
MSNAILAFAEQRNGNLRKTAFEVVSAAAELASQKQGEVVALLIGSGVESLAAELGKYGAAKVLVYDDAAFGDYTGEAYGAAAANAVEKTAPCAALFPHSSLGKDLAPRAAAKAGTSLIADCVELKSEGDKFAARRPIFAGKAFAWTESSAGIFFASLRPNVFTPKESGGDAQAEKVDFTPDSGDLKVKLKEFAKTAGDRVELTEAEIIVSGGRGLKGPENYNIIEDLAQALRGAVGASRAAVDAGWRPHADQVGQTGKTVSPTVYIACGISGAIQHLAGMSSSKVIVAINKDPEAPIFKLADYGIVGDLFEVVPALTEEFRKVIEQ